MKTFRENPILQALAAVLVFWIVVMTAGVMGWVPMGVPEACVHQPGGYNTFAGCRIK